MQEEVFEVKDLFEVGTLGPTGIIHMFESQASAYQAHLTIILTFTKFINVRVSGMVDLGQHPNNECMGANGEKKFLQCTFQGLQRSNLPRFTLVD